MADVFSIDGQTFNLPIFSYTIGTEILDGEATGRMSADKWPMFRQPQGVIVNIEQIEFGLCDDSKQDFIELVQVLRSFGEKDFRVVRLKTQVDDIEQPMYGASFKQDIRIIDRDNVTYWGNLVVKFVAKEGI